MKTNRKIKYTNEKIGTVKVIDDFLPSPEQLAIKEETVKITLSVTKNSVDYFKKQAKIHHSQYQKMMRALLDHYVSLQLNQGQKKHRL